MKPQLLTTSKCTRCAMAKRMLDMHKIDYETVVLDTKEGRPIQEKYNVMSVPMMLSLDKIMDVQNFIASI